jgi:hypothetical protein
MSIFKNCLHAVAGIPVAFVLSISGDAETVGIFFDPAAKQVQFAAHDVKAALEKKNFTVDMLPLNSLQPTYNNKKVVIALAANESIRKRLETLGATMPPELGTQAYCIRTTDEPQKAYWVIGGDANGAMYGGLQLAEDIMVDDFKSSYTKEESPAILRRGIKLNVPFDKESSTYGNPKASAAMNSIHNVWDMSFWTTWFDEMARNRYNVLSVWSNHPFTSMIKMPDYPDVAIRNVTSHDGKIKKMSIDEKIAFMKQVMSYAKSRGFDFYLVTWNIWTDGASGKYGITDEKQDAATSEPTIQYMRKCMITLLETYPDLDGFGITQGEHMSEDDPANGNFLARTYGEGVVDYAKRHPNRKFTFIHRWHLADFTEIKKHFGELMSLPNLNFEMSFKYSLAHMYGNPVPQRMHDSHIKPLVENRLKSWLTVRNDDFYYHDWGNPDFARAYVNGMVDRGDWFVGFYMGSDGFSPTRTFFSKNPVTQGLLEVQRQWYMFKIWGRVSYNPKTPDSVFKNQMAFKFPEVPSDKLFSAWDLASRGLPKLGDLITGTLGRDNQWWPEACQSDEAFLTVADFGNSKATKGSKLASIADTAKDDLEGKQSAYSVADEIENDAKAALAIIDPMNAGKNKHLEVTLNNLRTLSYLSIYYAYKVRGAIHVKAEEREKAKESLGNAHSWWMRYSSLMDNMYQGMTMARTLDLPNWHAHDASVLKEYTDLGGIAPVPPDKVSTTH